jgi:hypothetical protein
LIYSGTLSNSGETLWLFGPHGEVVDTANVKTGAWPAGDATTRATMERRGAVTDDKYAWGTNTGFITYGIDKDKYPILGTPRGPNSVLWPVPSPTPLPNSARVLINEFLPHPKYDWNGDGRLTSSDEFIELINTGTATISLKEWVLDDSEDGSTAYALPDIELAPGEVVTLFSSETGLSLSDRGDAVRLFLPDGALVDEYAYNYAREYNLSWCRLPNGVEELAYPCWPTPGNSNASYPLSSLISKEQPNPKISPRRFLPRIRNFCWYR